MKPKEKDSIRKQIQEEIHTTEKSVLRYQDLAKPIAPENAIGRISRMDAINNRSISEEALRKAKLKLNNLQIALSNIDDDDFFNTHWLDVFFYVFTEIGEHIRIRLGEQVADAVATVNGGASRVHLLGHSLGCAVIHDTLAK